MRFKSSKQVCVDSIHAIEFPYMVSSPSDFVFFGVRATGDSRNKDLRRDARAEVEERV